MAIVRSRLGEDVVAWVSESHLDSSVKTDADVTWYTRLPMTRILGGRAFFQAGALREPFLISSLIVDLNPRSLSAWALLMGRRLLGKRTAVWGHLYPQSGANSRTSFLRLAMRKLASATITYTYNDGERARKDLQSQDVWVAPNAIFREASIVPARGDAARNDVLYVGRLTEGKKVSVLIRAFAHLSPSLPDARLVLIGDGEDRDRYVRLAADLGLSERVHFAGWVREPNSLRAAYSQAFAATSPGFLGLGVTQSLGYGIPMVISRDELHSPEIELAEWGGVRWFKTDDPRAMADELHSLWDQRDELPMSELSARVRETYSAEAMADGLIGALEVQNSETK